MRKYTVMHRSRQEPSAQLDKHYYSVELWSEEFAPCGNVRQDVIKLAFSVEQGQSLTVGSTAVLYLPDERQKMIDRLSAMLEKASHDDSKTPHEFVQTCPESTQSGYWRLVAESCINLLL
jgi:hypothetical protein